MIHSYPAAVCEMNIEPDRADLVFGGWDSAVCESAGEYRQRRPEESILYGVVAGHVETFLARQRERDRLVPRFVEREFRSFLDCGILAGGFLREARRRPDQKPDLRRGCLNLLSLTGRRRM